MLIITSRTVKIILVASLIIFVSTPHAVAHHGWGWATDEEFEITGRITLVRLGNPHGEITLMVDRSEWIIEVGQPWRNQRAGLSEEKLRVGKTVTVHGHRSSKSDERLVKAERIIVDGVDHNLYPDRES